MPDSPPAAPPGPAEVARLIAALRSAEDRFHAIVERSADGVIVLRTDGAIAYVNRAASELLNRKAETLVGQVFGVPVMPGEVTEIEVLRPNRPPAFAEVQVTETLWQGTPAYLATLRDVTDRRRREQEAREEIRRRDQFLAVLSHELRNPLCAITNAAKILKVAPDHRSWRHAQGVIERESELMKRLLDDLLDVARVTKGKIQLRRKRINVSELIGHVGQSLAPMLHDEGLRFCVEPPDEPLWVEVDAARIEQVLNNLLSNAARYSKPGGHVRMTAFRDAEMAAILVHDDGIGIPPDRLSSIFEPFEQVEHSLSRSGCGLGIGLCLVRSIVEIHGGRVTAHSDGLGHGSQFFVRLPLTQAPPKPPEPSAPEEIAVGERRILLVEDNEDARETLKMLLQLDGHEVETAKDGERGLEMLEFNRPDIALVDIGLPKLDGYELARRARQQLKSETLLVALTGYGLPADVKRAYDAGFDAHLTKPLDFRAFQKLLATLTRQKEAETGVR